MTILTATPAITNFIEAWRESLSRVLTKANLKSLAVEAVDASSCTDKIAKLTGKRYVAVLNASGRLRGTLRLLMSESDALQLSLVQTPEISKSSVQLDETRRGAAAELLNQAARIVSANWGPAVGKLEIAVVPTDDFNPESICGGLRVTGENFTPVLIALGPSTEFATSLEALTESTPPAKTGTESAPAFSPQSASSNLDLLFDIQLEATIRFGSREMLLRDILSLSAGAAIALDREADQPADLLVAGRLVARGEVIVVDGNFGLRITEVTSSNQRAELLQS